MANTKGRISNEMPVKPHGACPTTARSMSLS